MGGNGGEVNNINALQPLIGLILSEKLSNNAESNTSSEENQAMTKMKNEILSKLGYSSSVEIENLK